MSDVNSILIISIWIAIVLFTAAKCRELLPSKKELSRKIVHIGIGPVLPIAWQLGIPSIQALSFSAIVSIGLTINHRLRLLQALEDVNRKSYGTIAYGLSITFLIATSWSTNPAAVSAGVLVMAFGDGLAGLIGQNIKSPSWVILGQRKSLIGTTAMAIFGFLVLLLIMIISNEMIDPLKLMAIALMATVLEQISPWGADNLTVPIGVAYSWIWLANT